MGYCCGTPVACSLRHVQDLIIVGKWKLYRAFREVRVSQELQGQCVYLGGFSGIRAHSTLPHLGVAEGLLGDTPTTFPLNRI